MALYEKEYYYQKARETLEVTVLPEDIKEKIDQDYEEASKFPLEDYEKKARILADFEGAEEVIKLHSEILRNFLSVSKKVSDYNLYTPLSHVKAELLQLEFQTYKAMSSKMYKIEGSPKKGRKKN